MNDVLTRITKHIQPCGESGIIDDILGSFRHAAASGEIPLVLFCAGSSGKILHSLLTRHGIQPLCFCDNNVSRGGEVLCGVPIISFDELKSCHRESLIVIASTAYQKFVERQLLENDFCANRIVCLDARDTSCDGMLKRERILMFARNGDPTAVQDELRRDESRIAEAYSLFVDEKSRELFIRRLALVASGYEYHSYRDFLKAFSEPVLQLGYGNPERFSAVGSYFYFNNDVLRLQDGEVLVDGGAYSGDSTDEFVRACEKNRVRYNCVYCFEPDLSNYRKLLEKTSRYRDVICYPYGLWSHRATLQFVSSDQTESYCARIMGAGTSAQATADIEIETDSIDGQLSGRKTTLIKLDIEGAEKEAIRGAEETIKNYSPNLVLSVYHNTSDLYEIPLLVHQLNPGYRMYLRHLGNYFDDTVLLAKM